MPLAGPRNRQGNDRKKNMGKKIGSKEEKGGEEKREIIGINKLTCT